MKSRLKPKAPSRVQPWSIKIPVELFEELEEVAEHNRLTKSAIVLEAVELHLRNFEHPPKSRAGKGAR